VQPPIGVTVLQYIILAAAGIVATGGCFALGWFMRGLHEERIRWETEAGM
jgi:hypothetical protein